MAEVYDGVGVRNLGRKGCEELFEICVNLADPSLHKIFGFREEELLGRELGKVLHPIFTHVIAHLCLKYLVEGEKLRVSLYDAVLHTLLSKHLLKVSLVF